MKRNQVIAAIGPSVSRKSTLLQCLAGMLVPESGAGPDRKRYAITAAA